MGGSRIIVLGYEVLVDEQDYELVKSFGLSIVVRDHLRHVYINTQPYYKKPLHRILLGVEDPNIIVDHINGNGLDNRKHNLRLTTKVGNALNMRVNHNKKSGLPKGVYKEREGYKAQIRVNKRDEYLGHFSSISEAEAAYIKRVQLYWSTGK